MTQYLIILALLSPIILLWYISDYRERRELPKILTLIQTNPSNCWIITESGYLEVIRKGDERKIFNRSVVHCRERNILHYLTTEQKQRIKADTDSYLKIVTTHNYHIHD